ncbi:DUF4440 domain-containing protein [Cnuibacter sp. UC19_7]|uniref:nuclear transport factor 2 family protein n=1 Tax=Cnuibacter sp. UC19_7 TaxID=3350166 RepID=UPI00366DC3C1
MWEPDADAFTAIKDAELSLLTSGTRRDPDRVAALLADDFVEIGRSGRRWTGTEIVDSLADEPERPTPATSDWLFHRVADNLVLVTYVIRGDGVESRHSSLWRTDGPVLVFHQGTLVAP